MAAKTHGTAFIYGIDGAYLGASAQISNISRKKSDSINEFVENDSGQRTSSRHDDQMDVLDCTAKIVTSFTLLSIAAKVTLAASGAFDGDYRLVDSTETKQSKGFAEYKVTLQKDEYLTLT